MNARQNRFARAALVRRLRERTVAALRAHGVRRNASYVVAALHYRTADNRSKADPSNYLATLKPVVDALQPYSRTVSGPASATPGKVRENIGYGLIPNDDAEHAEQTTVIAHPPEPGRAAAWWVELTIRYRAGGTAEDAPLFDPDAMATQFAASLQFED